MEPEEQFEAWLRTTVERRAIHSQRNQEHQQLLRMYIDPLKTSCEDQEAVIEAIEDLENFMRNASQTGRNLWHSKMDLGEVLRVVREYSESGRDMDRLTSNVD